MKNFYHPDARDILARCKKLSHEDPSWRRDDKGILLNIQLECLLFYASRYFTSKDHQETDQDRC